MKRLKTFLETIRALPEGIRRALAAFSFIIAIVFMFHVWSLFLPSQLERAPGEEQKINLSAESQALSPAEGIAESLKSLDYLLPKIGVRDTSKGGLAAITTFLEKAWRYVYEPLK